MKERNMVTEEETESFDIYGDKSSTWLKGRSFLWKNFNLPVQPSSALQCLRFLWSRASGKRISPLWINNIIKSTVFPQFCDGISNHQTLGLHTPRCTNFCFRNSIIRHWARHLLIVLTLMSIINQWMIIPFDPSGALLEKTNSLLYWYFVLISSGLLILAAIPWAQ